MVAQQLPGKVARLAHVRLLSVCNEVQTVIVRMIGWRVGDPPRTSEHILRMDPILDLERRRLLISAALTAQARRRLGKQPRCQR